jgi:hypothetical protein
MTTLHDMLKGDGADRGQQQPRVDLRGRYQKIGLSAVAAAAPYRSGVEDCKADRQARQLASREWTQRRS